MKFITESDLRAQFHEQPFTDYRIEEGSRLTPGARQYLSDRRVHILESGTKTQPDKLAVKKEISDSDYSLAKERLMCQVEVLEAEFLVITSEIIGDNIEIAGQISKIGHEFGRIRSIIAEDTANSEINFTECTGMKQMNCCQDLGNCFEITDFYIQSPNGRILVQLNVLRARIRMLRIYADEAFDPEQDRERLAAVKDRMNQIINKISQIICAAAGVKECRRIQ
ncbi:MAG: hypothetical protein ACI4D3_03720 [Lachnospiraceae bacterium]